MRIQKLPWVRLRLCCTKGSGSGSIIDAEISVNKLCTPDSQNAIPLVLLVEIYILNYQYLKVLLLKQLPI